MLLTTGEHDVEEVEVPCIKSTTSAQEQSSGYQSAAAIMTQQSEHTMMM